jgi:hypothetical protein
MPFEAWRMESIEKQSSGSASGAQGWKARTERINP